MDAKSDGFFFTPTTLTVPHGTVVFFLDNVDGFFNHQMSINDASGNTLASSSSLKPGTKAAFTVVGLQAGSYTFLCTVLTANGRTHAQQGMTGNLTVS